MPDLDSGDRRFNSNYPDHTHKYSMLIREILSELTFMGSPCTKDCSGHKAGYEWGIARRGKIANSWSNSFNKGAEIAKAGY